MIRLHALQEGQLASRLPFKMNTQHANVKGDSQVGDMLTSSSYLAIVAFHQLRENSLPAHGNIYQIENKPYNVGFKQIYTAEVESVPLKTFRMC